MTSVKNIVTPDLGGATDVSVIEVLVKPGDKIEVDTPMVTLESDKATMEVPSTDAGVVKEIKVKVGDKITSGSVILTLETSAAAQKPKESAKEAAAPQASKEHETDKAKKETRKESTQKEGIRKPTQPGMSEERTSADETSEDELSEAETSEAETIETEAESKQTAESTQGEPKQTVLEGTLQTMSDVHAGPGVRRLARELGVNLTQVPGTGPKQRILKEDVQIFVKTQLSQLSGALTPATATLPAIDFSKFGPVSIQALSRIKKISGKNLQRNWMMIPHVTQFGEADITSLEEFRQSQKSEAEKQKIKLTPLVFIMKAVVASLKAFPHFNASLDPNGENLIMKEYFHLGVAVDTPDGLVVPVIRNVDKKGLMELAKELGEVSEKARKKQLTPGDMQGGCFSISSLGGIGGTAFTPIINYPEVAILGVSKTYYKPVYQEGQFVPRYVLPLSLSYDHRVVDGADGARFIMHLTQMLSDIRNLLL